MHTTTSPQARSSFSRMTQSFERPPMTLVTCDALVGERADDGQEHRGAHAAADAHGVAGRDEVRLAAEGAGDVLDGLADLEGRELGRAGADGLDHQGDGPGLGIVVGDRQRDALPARTLPDDDELAGTPDLRDPRSLDDEADDVRGELLALDDGMHGTSLVLRDRWMVAQITRPALPSHGPVPWVRRSRRAWDDGATRCRKGTPVRVAGRRSPAGPSARGEGDLEAG